MYWLVSWSPVTQSVAFDWLVGFTTNISLYEEVNFKVSIDRETYPEQLIQLYVITITQNRPQDSDCKLHLLLHVLLLLMSDYNNQFIPDFKTTFSFERRSKYSYYLRFYI